MDYTIIRIYLQPPYTRRRRQPPTQKVFVEMSLVQPLEASGFISKSRLSVDYGGKLE